MDGGVAQPEASVESNAIVDRHAAIYGLYATSVRRRCLRLTGDPTAADDLVQEVFAQFLAKVPSPPADMNVHGYLLAMARNVWLNQVRSDRAILVDELEQAEPADDRLEHDPVRRLLLGEQRMLVRAGTARLTEHQRRALTLRELDGRSYAEIGSELGLATNAVAQVVWRARGQLRRTIRRSQVDVDRLPEECRGMLDDLSDLLERADRPVPAELETHLAGCRSCRRTLATYQEAGSRLRGAVPLVPLAALLARAAGTLRACIEVPAGIGTAAAVTATVIAVSGGGGAILANHAGVFSRSTPVARPEHVRKTPVVARVASREPVGEPVVFRDVSRPRDVDAAGPAASVRASVRPAVAAPHGRRSTRRARVAAAPPVARPVVPPVAPGVEKPHPPGADPSPPPSSGPPATADPAGPPDQPTAKTASKDAAKAAKAAAKEDRKAAKEAAPGTSKAADAPGHAQDENADDASDGSPGNSKKDEGGAASGKQHGGGSAAASPDSPAATPSGVSVPATTSPSSTAPGQVKKHADDPPPADGSATTGEPSAPVPDPAAVPETVPAAPEHENNGKGHASP
jgi:RNA polymerase sigma-70 factor (ECF subfamily)